jgi:phage shock protein E
MRRNSVLMLGLLLVLLAGTAILVRSRPRETVALDSSKQMHQQDFSDIQTEQQQSSALLLDVRTSEEYATGHVMGASLFPLTDMQLGKLPNVDRGAKIYVYCRSGNRSSQAKTLLDQNGFRNVVDLGSMDNVMGMGASKVTQ